MTKTFYTYVHLRPDGSPFYVGKGSTRKRSHDFNHHSRSRFHQNVVNKYGRKNIGIAVYNCRDEKHAFKLESELIAMFRDWGHELVNHTDGGEGAAGYKFSDELKALKSAQTKAYFENNPEHKAKHVEMLKRVHNDPEMKARRVATQKKTWEANPDVREKHRAAITATFSDDPKYAEYNAWRKEWHNAPETRKKRSESAKKQWADRREKMMASLRRGALPEEAKALYFNEARSKNQSEKMRRPENVEKSRHTALTILHSPEVRARQGATMRSLQWINDGEKRKRVADPAPYLARGWKMGKDIGLQTWVSKAGKSRRVTNPEEYLADGWVLGRPKWGKHASLATS